MEHTRSPPQHFLLVTYPGQGNINPVLHLAKRLVDTTNTLVTFAISMSAYRRMFPSSPDQQVDEGGVSYIPISDGYDDGLKDFSQFNHYMAQFKLVGSRSLSDLIVELAARGRPVTCIVYTILLSWAANVALEHGIPSVLYWIQSASVFAICYHYFHGHDSIIAAHAEDPLFTVDLPRLPPLKIRDLPSFLTMSVDDPSYTAFVAVRKLFAMLDKQKTWPKPKVLINTFDGLEDDVIASLDKLELITIGPLVPSWSYGGDHEGTKDHNNDTSGDLFKPDEKKYMEWLDTKPEKSVVYVSFGSLVTIKKQQMEEILQGLTDNRRPYLWVVRKDNRGEGVELEEGEDAMVVEWCSQVRVLTHPAVGCFVTHCGWNSTVESLVCGVPAVGVPQWSDQKMNAKLAAEVWGTGVRGVVDEEGVLDRKELKRCLDIVMGEGERAENVRKNALKWSTKAREAVGEGGSSHRNLKAFVEAVVITNS